ncbi:MAG TPA: hypothetical protein VFK79_03320 [Xanthobacteraceae bacterium]|nr:hypothetical protein [Xanthobacteraceae bacterium]
MHFRNCWFACALAGVLSLSVGAGVAHAQGNGTIQKADPDIPGDGTMGPAAHAAMTRGRLPISDEEVAMKSAANHALQEEMNSRAPIPPAAEPEESDSPAAPAIVGGHSFVGQSDPNSSPPDSTGTIGPVSYIQTVNRRVKIYNRHSHASMATGTLNALAGNAASVNSFDPQIMWDPTTSRFYYVMDSVFSAANNKLAFGFSRTANPTSLSTADWCKYHYTPADPARFPDYPKLGDSRFFIIIGVNSFRPGFVGSDLIAISKPPAGTACPDETSFKIGTQLNLRDTSNRRVFTPVPANQVDDNAVGYVIARHGSLPANRFWFFTVSRNSITGEPVFGTARGLAVPSYTIPPSALQPSFAQVLDTLDTRHTQAVQAINPNRGSVHSFYVQHTVRHASQNRSIVRWYEINPAGSPVLLRRGEIGAGNDNFYFNAAISPDRRKDGAAVRFGDSFVIEYNQSSRVNNINPRIVAASSFNGGALSTKVIKTGRGYRDFTCPNAGQTCRWGDYSSAMPDPRPTTTGRGEVWITNQYSSVANPSTTRANWSTWIAAVRP